MPIDCDDRAKDDIRTLVTGSWEPRAVVAHDSNVFAALRCVERVLVVREPL
jgi:hypothetical protein